MTMTTPVKRLLVLGLGKSGQAVARAALAGAGFLGEIAHLTLVDGADNPGLRAAVADISASRPASLEIETRFGARDLSDDIGRFDLGVISPGLAPHDSLTVAALACCDELISELEFAWRLARDDQQWIAITGSNGKTTTTMLATHLLRAAGRSAASVGNIGETVTATLLAASAPEILVAEVSSFQLEFATSFAPQAAALLNIAADHLDWHGSLENYARAKQKVFAHQRAGDVALISDEDPFADQSRAVIQATPATAVTVSLRGACAPPAAWLEAGTLWLQHDPARPPEALCHRDELQIHGAHNISNALFAAALVAHFGLSAAEIAAGLKTFTAPAHRLEFVAEIAGVRYFDDSKATNPDSVLAALTAFEVGQAHLLLGGRGKGTSYKELARVATARAHAVYLFGEEGPVLARAFHTAPNINVYPTLEEAFNAAARAARPGEAVLLSPACASFDAFDSYAQRGEYFAALVRAREQEQR